MAALSLEELPAGSLCVVDTNILIYAEQGSSLQARRLMRRIEELEIRAVLPQPVWQETMHRLMVAEALMLGKVRGPNPARQLSARPEVIRKLTIYQDKIQALMAMGFAFEPCHEDDLLGKAVEIQRQYGLLTNDSLIAAITLRIGADALVSADMRYTEVSQLTVYTPTDLKVDK